MLGFYQYYKVSLGSQASKKCGAQKNMVSTSVLDVGVVNMSIQQILAAENQTNSST